MKYRLVKLTMLALLIIIVAVLFLMMDTAEGHIGPPKDGMLPPGDTVLWCWDSSIPEVFETNGWPVVAKCPAQESFDEYLPVMIDD